MLRVKISGDTSSLFQVVAAASENSDSSGGGDHITVTENRPSPPSPPHEPTLHGSGYSNGNGGGNSNLTKPELPKYKLLNATDIFFSDMDISSSLVNALTIGQEVEMYSFPQINTWLQRISALFTIGELGASLATGKNRDAFQISTNLLISSVLGELAEVSLVTGNLPLAIVATAAMIGFSFYSMATSNQSGISDRAFNWATNGGLRLESPRWDNYIGVPY